MFNNVTAAISCVSFFNVEMHRIKPCHKFMWKQIICRIGLRGNGFDINQFLSGSLYEMTARQTYTPCHDTALYCLHL